MSEVTIFYDASCPICVSEMKVLRVDLPSANFINVLNTEQMAAYPEIIVTECLRDLHVIDKDGELRIAVDANLYLKELTGQDKYLKFYKIPIFRNFADIHYKVSTFYRYCVTRFITGYIEQKTL